jgi:hypothetical protein
MSQFTDAKFDYYDAFGTTAGFTSVWSDYSVENLTDRHPHPGANTLVYTEHWGKQPVSVAITGDTFGDLWRAADAAIRQSADTHHRYVERFVADRGDPSVLKLYTGS